MARPKKAPDPAISALTDAGLSENEAVLYLEMLKRPYLSARQLTTYAPFTRTMLYHILEKLERKGLVKSIKERGRTRYIAEDPEIIHELLDDAKNDFEKRLNHTRALIPDFKRMYILAGTRPKVRIFEGVLEYQRVLDDIINSKPTQVWAYASVGGKQYESEIWLEHERRRVSKKIDKQILFFENKRALAFLEKNRYNDYTHYRSITENIDMFSANVMLYNNKILYTNYDDKYEPVTVLIESKELFDMQKSLFAHLWRTAKNRTLYFINKD